ncbi:uncharacterized protein K460DRAFT_148107 [Cucurbitaria berberidis CBS 394.84]|uniref:RlpA-like protein double-psi beta-barrel domain-containing protein n=1 Tax=Cucurbitaria berberidis CBS 394.84 TaxID=1168544 RepID=A0A9P4L6A2_9PLEO|nr:uncharacterized protein K460DRAFT_148107 [Cucurbitaria berberidis CBS 394.84]KAF1843590.1 hypothetical protein K460DRAFT_148107 [Cucurbitaria berberidis CBS 394.84]
MPRNPLSRHDTSKTTTSARRFEISNPVPCDAEGTAAISPLHGHSFGTAAEFDRTSLFKEPPPLPPLNIQKSRQLKEERCVPEALNHEVYERDIWGVTKGRISSLFDRTRSKEQERYSSSEYSSYSPKSRTYPRQDTDTCDPPSSTKLNLTPYYIMAIISVVAVAALIVSIAALAKGLHLEKPQLQTTTSDVQSVTLTLWRTLSMTKSDDDATSIMPVTSYLSPVQTAAQTTSSTKSSKTTSRTTSHSLTVNGDINHDSRLVQREEELVHPNTECDSMPLTTTTAISDTLRQTDIQPTQTSTITHSTQSNAAVRRWYVPFQWPTKTLPGMASRTQTSATRTSSINRRQAPGRKLIYWEAYSQLQLQAAQLCYATKVYLDAGLTPSFVKNTDDDSMAKIVNEKLCTRMDTEFALVNQGKACETKSEWENLKKAVEELCKAEKSGKVVIQSVDLLCSIKGVLEGNVNECEGAGNGTSSSAATSTARTQSITTPSSVLLPSPSPHVPSQEITSFSLLSSVIAPSSPPVTPSSDQRPLIAGAATCTTPVSQLTFSGPAAWSTPIITSISPWVGAFDWVGASAHGISPTAELPCGYTSLAPSHVVVPATVQTGDISHYSDLEAFSADPACPDTGKLQHNEALAAIGWKLFDFGRAGTINGTSALCGRKILAWCQRKDGTKNEVNVWVRDRCAGCRPQDLDVLTDVFPFCTNPDVGRAAVSWRWVEDGETKTK